MSQSIAPQALKLFASCLKTVPDPRSKRGISHPLRTLLALVFLGLLANVSTPIAPQALKLFASCLKKVPDPRSKRGISHPLRTLLALVFLGLLANVSTPAEIARWTEQHFKMLQKFLRFGKIKGVLSVPCDNTFTRVLKKLSLYDLQHAFAEFINVLLQDTSLVAAVDGKAAKQMKDAEGNPILMLNVFAQTLKLHLASWSVQGDKTNEPGCLKQHLAELFSMYPCLKLLTGDAIYAQRPLLEALQEYHCDYLFQVKNNQPKILQKVKTLFANVSEQESQDCQFHKKRGLRKHAVCG